MSEYSTLTPSKRLTDTVAQGGATAWVHSATEHLPPEDVARLHLGFQERYGWALVKVMSDYRPAIAPPTDRDDHRAWACEYLDALDEMLHRQQHVLRMVRAGVTDVPLCETVFTPFQLVVRTVGRAAAYRIAADETVVSALLGGIAQRQVWHLEAAGRAGVDAVFLSTNAFGQNRESLLEQWDSFILTSTDLLSLVHLHGADLRGIAAPDIYRRADLLSIGHSVPHAEVNGVFGDSIPLMGGLDELNSLYPDDAEVTAEARSHAAGRGRLPYLFAPGCTVHSDTPSRVFDAFHNASRQLSLEGMIH